MLPLLLILGALCIPFTLVQAASYRLKDDYTNGNFFDKFDFFTGPDPTNGYVQYLTRSNATDCGLIKSQNPPSWGVDDNNALEPSNPAGRPSVRMTSKNLYNHGLFILDLAHMPDSVCGTWPAFWTFGQTAQWPVSGEIDIIEFVNKQPHNLMTLHTNSGCSITGDRNLQTGRLETGNTCDVNQGNGCTINATNSNSAGTGFNTHGGGVYAMEWTSSLIQIWFFPHGWVPKTILNGSPNPTVDFGKPLARFQGDCNIDQHFYDHAIIFDTTFCGSWAGSTYSQDGCPLYNGMNDLNSCVKFVAENPHAFKNSYWTVNSLKVFQAASGISARSTSSSSTEATSAADEVALSEQVTSAASSSTPADTASTAPTSSKHRHTAGGWNRRHEHRGRLQR